MDNIHPLSQKEQLDLLCLSETFLTDSVNNCMLVFPGYAICQRDRATGTREVRRRCRRTLSRHPERVPAPRAG